MRMLILFVVTGFFLSPLRTNSQNLVAWYDATDVTTVHTIGSTVTQLDDKSSTPAANHYNLTRSGTGSCTYHSEFLPSTKPYINFPDNTIKLQIASTSTIAQPYTVYMVVRQNNFQNEGVIATFNTTDVGGGAGVKQNNEAGIQSVIPHAGANNNNDKRNKLPNLYSNSWRLLKFVYNGSQSYESVNGGARLLSFLFPYPDAGNPSTFNFLPGTNAIKTISIGGGINLDFSEMQIYDGVLTDANAISIEQALMTKYGLKPVIGIKGFGDSNTVGLTTSNEDTKCWLYLTATAKGKNYYNYGINTSVVFGDRDPAHPHPEQNLYGFKATRVLGAYGAPYDYVFFMFGTNDVAVGIDDTWRNTYESYIQESFINLHYDTARYKLIICSPPHASNATFDLVRSYVSQIASDLGIQFADLYTRLNNTGAISSYMNADGIHLNDAGHAFASQYFQGFIDNNVALPVNFTLFNSACVNDGVKLSWKTSQEMNSKRFEVERSADGRSWQAIGSVNSAGTATTESNYTFRDNTSSLNFLYRIAAYDVNDKKTYTAVLKSSCSAKEEFSVYPNPIRDVAMLSITSNADAPIILRVFDAKGSMVRSVQAALLQGNNQLQVYMGGLAKGTYSLSASWNNTVKTIMLVK